MIEHFKNIFRRIFSNEETVVFFLIIISTLILFSFFIEVLTPFIISIIVAYLLVGLQKKIETYGVAPRISTIIAFSIFIIVGAAMFTWLIPLLYVQLQSFVLDIPRLFNEFLNFVSTIPAAFPDLVNLKQKIVIEHITMELTM